VLHSYVSDNNRVGGVAVIHRESVNIRPIDLGQYSSFEYLFTKIDSSSTPVIIAAIYRHPGHVSVPFCDELSDLFDRLLQLGIRYIVCGDLNCPDKTGRDLIDVHLQLVLSRYNVLQLVADPTHDKGNTLDLLIVPEQHADLIQDVSTHSLCFTDHALVRCRLGVPRMRPTLQQYSYRRVNRMDMEAFRQDILKSRLYDQSTTTDTADKYADLFAAEVTRILDHHAPLKTKTKRQGAHEG